MKRSISIVLAVMLCMIMAIGTTAASADGNYDDIVEPANLLCSLMGHERKWIWLEDGVLCTTPNETYCQYWYDTIITICDRCGETLEGPIKDITGGFSHQFDGNTCTHCGYTRSW